MGALLEQTKKPELALKAYNRALNLTKPGSKSRQVRSKMYASNLRYAR